jgi:hypothetical protein
MAHDCTDEKDLQQIIAILRKFETVFLPKLID